jgi:NADH:ubiquinone oxidoreductase subunit 6 (subunit J)
MIIAIVVYVLASYLLFYFAARHDSKISGKSWWEEATPAFVFAPVFAPVLFINIIWVNLRR